MVDGATGETGDNAALLVDSMHSKSARAAVPILLHHSVGRNATEKAKKQDTVVAMLALVRVLFFITCTGGFFHVETLTVYRCDRV